VGSVVTVSWNLRGGKRGSRSEGDEIESPKQSFGVLF